MCNFESYSQLGMAKEEYEHLMNCGAIADDMLCQYKQQVADIESAKPIAALSYQDFDDASYSYKVIMKRIHEFEEDLDDEHEVALMLASFGQSLTLSVTDIGYSNPSTLVFYGYVGEQFATLIQHMSQLNFLLLAVKKADPEKPPRRIGFAPSSEDSESQ